jgi:hypothetical protein
MKYYDTEIWECIEAHVQHGNNLSTPPNVIAERLQGVIDCPDARFRNDELMQAFGWHLDPQPRGAQFWNNVFKELRE